MCATAQQCRLRPHNSGKETLNDRLGKAISDYFNKSDSDALLRLKALLENGGDINLTLPHGQTPFLIACHARDQTLMNQLLAQGANVESTLAFVKAVGDTPLKAFIEQYTREWKISKLILEYFKKVDAGALTHLKSLLQSGQDINFTRSSGETPFLVAAHACDKEFMSFLLDNGANPQPAIDIARRKGDRHLVAFVEEFLKQRDISSTLQVLHQTYTTLLQKSKNAKSKYRGGSKKRWRSKRVKKFPPKYKEFKVK